MAILEQIVRYKYRAVKTFILYLLMMVSGMGVTLLGVTLLDLQIAVSVPLDRITLILPSFSLGFIVGAITCGILVEFIDFQILLMITSFLFTFTSVILPWNRRFVDLCINSAVNGLLSGFINSGGNTWILYIWGKESPAFMQALHFFFGVGAFVAPLIAEPYLLPLQDLHVNVTSNSTDIQLYTAEDLKISYSYAYLAIISLLFTIAFIVVYCIHQNKKPHPTYSKADGRDGTSNISATLKIIIIGIACMFMFFYYGLELSFGNLLTAFVVNCDLKLDKSTASYMTSLYWATFTFFRLFVIFISDVCSSQTILIFDLILVMASNVILWCFGNHSELCLWIAIAFMGFGTSPIFGCLFGFVQQIMHISSKTASLFFVFCSSGVFVFPYIMGIYMDTNPNVFIYTSFTCGTMCSITFVVLVAIKYIFIKNVISNNNEVKKEEKVTESKVEIDRS